MPGTEREWFGVVCRAPDPDGELECERLYPHMGWHSATLDDGAVLVEWNENGDVKRTERT